VLTASTARRRWRSSTRVGERRVSDVRMPKLDGFQLCRAIRRDARWARLPFIFYSSVFIGGPARDLAATSAPRPI